MESLTLAQVRAKIRELELQAERLERANKPGIAQLVGLIQKYDLSTSDWEFAAGVVGKRKRGVPKGTRLRAKYRNPLNPKETWAGRGLKPRWLSDLLRQGRKLEDLKA